MKCLFVPAAHKNDTDRNVDNYGRDVATYFLFVQTIIYSFIVMTVLGLAVLLPLHITGTLPESYAVRFSPVFTNKC
jgi:hypothetical protein